LAAKLKILELFDKHFEQFYDLSSEKVEDIGVVFEE
jgi:hypothetical protein